ncbi:4008_t:CDS:2 [Dentiscutata erythropus]|uniref:Inositol-1-monophosphatase n=1 Tax=Dentiscutata erythropus TaxID=1348616 RepID=A0A9N9ENC8_9GLOM|nr:4008_t:CDS:2 [Dentiscutata erythropus]
MPNILFALYLEHYLEFATKLAQQCGQIILEASKTRYTTGNKVYEKFGQQTDLVTETDIKVEELIKSKLKEKFPDHMFIGEETKAAGNHYEFTNEPTWIIDPIAINKEPVVGVVFNPFLNELFTARKGHGAFLNHTIRLPLSHPYPPPVLPFSLSQCLVAYECGGADRSDLVLNKKINSVQNLLRSPGEVSWSSKKAGSVHGIRNVGCCTMSMCYVAKGCLDIHFSIGCWEWDVAAALVILIESGGIMVNDHGFDKGTVDIFGRKYISIRGGSPCDGDENSKQSQLRLVREMLDVVEEIDCPRS